MLYDLGNAKIRVVGERWRQMAVIIDTGVLTRGQCGERCARWRDVPDNRRAVR